MSEATESGLTSVIIVAADSGSCLIDCVTRTLASTGPVEVIVSDNASNDGSIQRIEQCGENDTRVRVLRHPENLGFGTACNRAAAIARGDVLLFLNPDCRMEPETTARLRERWSNDRRIGVVGADIVDERGRAEPAARRRDPLLSRLAIKLSGLQRLSSRWPWLEGIDLPKRSDVSDTQTVDVVSGALMLLPRAVFDRVAGFDEGYFLHYEDIDLCRRVRDAGFKVVCANDVRVVHLKGTSSRSRPFFVARHKHRGMWRWFGKFDPAARNPLLRGLVWLGLRLHLLMLGPRYAWLAWRRRIQR